MEGLMSQRAFALTEVLVVAAILAAVAIPVMGLIFTGSREGALSEDFMFAEALASRFMEEWGALPFAKLDDLVPRKVTVQGGEVTPGPHKRMLASPQGFETQLQVARVREGLLSLEVTVSWQVPRERANRRFALLLLKAKPDLALEGAWPH